MRISKALGICAVLLTGVFAGLAAADPGAPLGCPPETYYTEATGGAARTDGLNFVYFDVVVRRYSQVTSNCGYKEWIETVGGHLTEAEFTVFAPSYAVTSFVIVRSMGSITWSGVGFYKHDTETYQVASGCGFGGLTFCNLNHVQMGSPMPGNLHHYYRTANLPPAYFGQPIIVQVNANLMGMSWPQPVSLTLPSPP